MSFSSILGSISLFSQNSLRAVTSEIEGTHGSH